MNRYGRVVVLYGGPSSEREVSLKSGAAVLAALLAQGIDAHGLDVGAGFVDRLLSGGYDRAFIMVHGRLGEDGAIQGLLETLGIPYTGSRVAASAVAMDKVLSKAIFRAAGIPTPDYRVLQNETDAEGLRDGRFPLILKPAQEGSSIGVHKVLAPADLMEAYRNTRAYGPVLAEQCIEGPEYTCAILGERVLPLIRLETPQGFYDYEAKYILNTTRYHCPAGLSDQKEHELREVALSAYRALGAEGWGRVDLMADAALRPYVLELNTVPGMTDHSLVPMAARAVGLSLEDVVEMILAQTLRMP